jgi:hypothetical protein
VAPVSASARPPRRSPFRRPRGFSASGCAGHSQAARHAPLFEFRLPLELSNRRRCDRRSGRGWVTAGFHPGDCNGSRRTPQPRRLGAPAGCAHHLGTGTNAACNSPGAPAEAVARLSWAFCPFSTCRQRRSGGATHCHVHRRSVLRVWSPSRRFDLSATGPALFRAGSAPGIRPFGASSARKVTRAFPHGVARIPFGLPVFPPHEAMGRPSGPRFPGFAPSERPWPPRRD